MARTTTAAVSRTRRSPAQAVEPEPVGLELAGVALSLGAVLLGAAIVTLGPVGGSLRNVTGAIGAFAAEAVTGAVGLGAWVLPFVALAWGITCLRGRRPANWLRAALLLPLLMGITAVLGALIFERGVLPGLARSGPGGYFGLALGSVTYSAFGKASGLVAAVAWIAVFRVMTQIDLVQGVIRLAHGVVERVGTRMRQSDGEASEGGVAVAEDEEGEWEYEDEEGYGESEYEEGEEGDGDEGDEGEPEEADEAPEAEGGAEPVIAALPPPPPAPVMPEPRRKPRRPKQRGAYIAPPLTLLTPGEHVCPDMVREEVEANAEVLEEALASFGVEARVVSNLRGPVITFYEIKVPSGIRLSRVTALTDDLAIALKAPSIRIVAPIPGRSTVGVEVPNTTREIVRMRDLLEAEGDKLDRAAIPVALGSDTAGRPIVEDLTKTPHLLIAGATGSGKSVCINAILLSILYTRGPDEVNLILVDPKQVELSFYEGIPHLLTPVVTDMRRAAKILEWAVDRMEERYAKLLACGVRNITGYNALPKSKREAARERTGMDEEELPDKMSYVVIVIDELADVILTNGKDVELAITRIAQKARAVGIHLVLATQRPSTNVITGLIKANMPTRCSFVVSSKIDSRVVLDANGADRLLGHGDMLYMHPRSLHLRRAQGTLVTDGEARATVEFLAQQYPDVEYEDLLKTKAGDLGDPLSEDDLYDDAVRAVLSTKLGSASMLQRRLGVGYTRASRLIDMMSDRGLVGPHVGSKAREVLMELESWEAAKAQADVPRPKASEYFDPDDPPPVDTSWD
jgi:S-DNA-T family DNA segregation ATPase FtsK/SpoIIIE